MTTERDNQTVSDAYRDIATQTTPAELDDRVLKLAADAVPSRYGLARAWVRPLAWAATIALSLALVLEISRVDDAPAPQTDSDAGLMKAKEEKDLQHGIAEKRAPATVTVEEIVVQDAAAEVEEIQTNASRARASYLAAPDEGAFCDTAARATADDWYACIEALREEGLNDAAESELEALRELFPDFATDRE